MLVGLEHGSCLCFRVLSSGQRFLHDGHAHFFHKPVGRATRPVGFSDRFLGAVGSFTLNPDGAPGFPREPLGGETEGPGFRDQGSLKWVWDQDLVPGFRARDQGWFKVA